MAGGEKNVLVVDASVVVKWFVLEEYSDEAGLLKRAYVEGLVDLASPSLLLYEVLNALKYSAAFGEDELKRIARVLEDYQFTLYPLQGELAQKTVEIAMRKGVTIYDASYVALAHMLDTVLYTADEKLIGKIGDPNTVEHIASFKY